MTKYRYDAAGKSALRSAITSHAGWDAIRASHGISSATLTVDLMESVAGMLSPPIDCSAFGRERGGGFPTSYGMPKPKTVTPDEMRAITDRALQLTRFANVEDETKFHAIVQTVAAQEGYGTEGQKASLLAIVMRAENVAHGFVTMPPAIVTRQAAPVSAPMQSNDQAALDVLRSLLGANNPAPAPAVDESRIIELIKAHAGVPAVITLNLQTPAAIVPRGDVLLHHKMPLLLAAMAANVNIMLVGGAGTGKTHAVKLAAELLGLDFKFSGAIDSPYKLTGFTDAQGRIVRTPFRDAVENGAVFLIDEADGCLPGAMLPINAVASNGLCDFPDAIIKAHTDFRLIMACNTFGRGADRQYVGRNQQDAAVLDRYAVLAWDIDPALEAGLLGLPRPANAPAPATVKPITDAVQLESNAKAWLARVQAIRSRIEKHKIRHIVSPRATVMGVKLLAAGWPWNEVEEACIFKGLDSDTRAKLAA